MARQGATNKKQVKAEERIAKLREYEDRLTKMNLAHKEEKHLSVVAEWQQKTDGRIRNLVVQQRFEALKARREANLDGRRQRLAAKLFQEDQQLKQELISNQETPEQRRAKLADRARELAARREAERQQLAAQLYERAFMESCDVLRDVNSKRVLYRTLDERTAQIEQRMADKVLEEEERRMFDEMNETERLKKEQRYLTEKQQQRQRIEETQRALGEQMRAHQERQEEEAAAKQQETAELRMLWAAMAREQEEADITDRERMKKLAAELQEFNRIKQAEMSERERKERELDLKILQEALAREAADEAAEGAARQKRQADVKRYREQLAVMMQQEAEETADRDAMIDAVFREQQRKQDAELAAREEARRKLMAEVDAIRQEQIGYKQMQRQQDLDTKALERLQLEEEERQRNSEGSWQKMSQRKKALETRLELQTQMVAKAHIKAAEEDEKLRALEVAQHNEKAYMGKVTEALQKTDPPQWYGRKKFDWYT